MSLVSHNHVTDYKKGNVITSPLKFDEALDYLIEASGATLVKTKSLYHTPNRGAEKAGLYMFKTTKDIDVFKHALHKSSNVIVNMTIPAGSMIHIGTQSIGGNKTNHKCRASKAIVKSIVGMEWPHQEFATANSKHSSWFQYKVGDVLKPASRFSTALSICDSGIHFFLDVASCFTYCYAALVSKYDKENRPSQWKVK